MAIKEKKKGDGKKAEPLVRRKGFQFAMVAVISALLTMAYIWFIHRPLYAQFVQMKSEHEKLVTEVKDLRSQPVDHVPESEMKKAREEADASKAALDAVRARLLAGEEGRLAILSRVNELAGEYRMEVKGVEPVSPKDLPAKVKDSAELRKGIDLRHFSLSLKGRYGGLILFMDEVSGMEKVVAFENVSVRQQEDGVPLVEILLGI